MPARPKNEEEFQRREAAGVIRASRFVRQYAHSRESISLETICAIHKYIFQEAWPEVAGNMRTENLEISDSKHLPPHHTEVGDRMKVFGTELSKRIQALKSVEHLFIDGGELTEQELGDLDKIIETAAWLHHQITYIHPFREGNGRTARLAGNLILERFGLVGISIKVERENKNRYREALAQIDQHQDYEPLKSLIYEGLADRYGGVAVKYLK